MHKRRKPRALTLTLPNAKQPYFMVDGKRYTLRNVSQEGVGLWMRAPAPFGLVPGARVSGDVVIGNEIFPVGLEIRHVSSHLVGLRFTQAPPELSKLFQELLEPSHYASGIVARPESGQIDPKRNLHRLWYRGEVDTELMVWYQESRMIQAIQIRWLGRWVFRQLNQKAETGYLVEDGNPQPTTELKEAELWSRQSPADPEIIGQAAQFLTSVPPPLPGAILWQFLEIGEQVYLPENFFSKSKVA